MSLKGISLNVLLITAFRWLAINWFDCMTCTKKFLYQTMIKPRGRVEKEEKTRTQTGEFS